jgi:hypothetical protein
MGEIFRKMASVNPITRSGTGPSAGTDAGVGDDVGEGVVDAAPVEHGEL